MMLPRPTTHAGRRGNTLIETAMVLPIMILLVISVLDYGLFLLFRHLINDLARDGGRLASVSTKSGVDVRAQLLGRLSTLPGSGLLSSKAVEIYRTDASGVRVTGVDWTAAQFGQSFAVEVQANYNPILRAAVLLNGRVVTIFPTSGNPPVTPIVARCVTFSEFD